MADADYLRALLEITGVLTIGFLWYVGSTDVRQDYDLDYSWPMFRRKLTGDAIGFDTNHFGTNFIGHPLGGTSYYVAARSNRLDIATSFGLAVGGSLIWEYFGEARERVSLNDMIVTPLAGVAIGEPWTQLGAFFDRSAPNLRNRILGSFFAPLKSLNDLFDGYEPARAKRLDRYGFPLDEWHRFDLTAAAALAVFDRKAPDEARDVTPEWRIGLASRLARLPGYDEAGRHSLFFSDGNVSSIGFELAFGDGAVVDLNFTTQFVVVGHYFHEAVRTESGALLGNDLVVGLSTAFQYSVHDYDRDRPQPIDRLSSVQPLALYFAHRGVFGDMRVHSRLEAGPSFAGVSAYGLTAYRLRADALELPELIRDRNYYYGLGGSAEAALGFELGLFEAEGSLRFESYSNVDGPLPASDQRARLRARAGMGIPGTPARVNAVLERRSRTGELGSSRATRGELSMGLEIGARF